MVATPSTRTSTGTVAPAAAGLSLAEAREIIDRAIDKAGEYLQNGAFAVVDAAGNIISLSKMDDAPAAAPGVARAKAVLAAVMQGPTNVFADRMDLHPVRYAAYQRILRDKTFPGGGGAPIMKGQRCVGGLATGPGVAPLTSIPGVHPSQLMSGNARGNAEDLVICYALRIPYRSQHGEGVH
jgi:uncharacterized protein GlcG (DUF336 family)